MRRQLFLPTLCAILFLASAVTGTIAQTTGDLDPATRRTMENAAAQGFQLQTSLNISGLGAISQAPTKTVQDATKKQTKSAKGTPATAPATAANGAAAPGGAAAPASAAKKPAAKTDDKGVATSPGTVADNASVESVLLPYEVCRRVFGKQVALNYAAVELTVSNRSSSASLILHSIFIDYSQWALSGNMYFHGQASNDASASYGSAKGAPPAKSKRNPKYTPYQTPNDPTQVASVEYRVVRGGLLDAQPWTLRNVLMRSLEAAGAVATAYSFSISEPGIVRGIAAFSGQVVPAARALIPDGTVDQLNRISDLGFQVNKVIPKNSSDIVVAFFPIDRFLTPGLKKLYLKSPALFFAPYALVLDNTARQDLLPIIENFMPSGVQPSPKAAANAFLNELAMQYMTDVAQDSGSNDNDENCQHPSTTTNTPLTPQETCIIKKFLAHASLNTVHVVVGGEMTVNVADIPATIISVDMDDGSNNLDKWNKSGKQTGVIHGTYLSGGDPEIAEDKDLGITEIETIPDTSTDTELHFTMTLKDTIPSGKKLTFRVKKTNTSGNAVESLPYVFVVDGTATVKPEVTGAQVKNNVLTISGTGFPVSKPESMTIQLHSAISKPSDYTLNDSAFTLPNANETDIKLEGLKDKDSKSVTLTPGCWTVKSVISGTDADGEASFPVFPPQEPAVTSAKQSADGKTIDVTGTNFVDLGACGNTLVFKVMNSKTQATQRVTGYKPKSSTEVVFDYPSAAGGSWKVLVGYRDAKGQGVAVTNK